VKITPIVIDKFAKFIVGGVPFESMKRVVATLDDADLSGSAKRAAALAEFKKFSYLLTDFLVNLAVELAVAWLKSRNGKL